MQSTPSTLSVSAALMLRNVLRYPDALLPLREQPDRISDATILELLRRDNHVKALSRQIADKFEFNGVTFGRGESLYLFFPAINLDPDHWHDPLTLDFSRDFSHGSQHIFGSARHACIGVQLSMVFFRQLLPIMLKAIPTHAELDQQHCEVDGDWVVERVITRMPIIVH